MLNYGASRENLVIRAFIFHSYLISRSAPLSGRPVYARTVNISLPLRPCQYLFVPFLLRFLLTMPTERCRVYSAAQMSAIGRHMLMLRALVPSESSGCLAMMHICRYTAYGIVVYTTQQSAKPDVFLRRMCVLQLRTGRIIISSLMTHEKRGP